MEAAAHPHPIAAAPVADEREGPAADGLVQPTGDVFGELLAFPDRQIVDAVPANVLGRNVARVCVAKRQSLRWGEIRIAQDLVVLGNQRGVTRTIGVEAAVAVAGTARIGRGHGMGISVKRLGRESTRESVVEFELDRLGVGIAVVLERPICAAPVGVETPEIGIARVTTRTEQAGCGTVIVQRLGIVPGPALLQVAAVVTDVAGPQSSVFAQFALNDEGPRLHHVVIPVAEIERSEGLRVGSYRRGRDRSLIHVIGGRRSAGLTVHEIRAIGGGDVVRKHQVQRHLGAHNLEDLRQRHRPVVDAVRRTHHPVVGELVGEPQPRAEIVIDAGRKRAGESSLGSSFRGHATRRIGGQHRGRDVRERRQGGIEWRDHRHIGGGDGIHIQVQEPVVFFGVGSPLIPTQPVIDGQPMIDLPTVLEEGPELLLPPVEVAVVKLVVQASRESEFDIGKSIPSVWDRGLVGGDKLGSPFVVEGFLALSLLHFADVIVFDATAEAELEVVLALDPGDSVVQLVLGLFLVLQVVRVPTAAVKEVSIVGVVVGVDRGPSFRAKGIRHAKLGGPIGAVGEDALVVRGAVDGDLKLIQQRGFEDVNLAHYAGGQSIGGEPGAAAIGATQRRKAIMAAILLVTLV